MRRALLAAAIVALLTCGAEAQERQLGAKLGPSFATVSFEPDQGDEHEHRIAIGGGGFAVLPTGLRRVAMQIEALVSPRGGKLYSAEDATTGAVLLHYLDLPVLLRIAGPRSGSRSFHLFGGPYAGIRLSAKREVSVVAGSIRTGVRENMSREVERFDFGLALGGGADLGRRLVIDGRYLHALTRLNTDDSDGVSIRNRGFTVMAGFRF